MSVKIDIDPALYGQLANMTVEWAIGRLERRAKQRARDMDPGAVLAGVRELLAGYETTDEIIAEERARIIAEGAAAAGAGEAEDLGEE